MSDRPVDTPTEFPRDPISGRLDSWKDIAAYLKRDVSTVQRWEKREGMPVHRHVHGTLGSVYAFRAELDAWWQSRPLGDQPAASGRERVRTSEIPTHASRTWRQATMWAIAAGAILMLGVSLSVLQRSDYFWRNPLVGAQFRPLTDFDGNEFAAAISRDGKFVAFLSDRDGQVDAWVTQVGSGQFHNLTRGALRELVNPSVRTIGFSPDAAFVSFWLRRPDASKPDDIGVWAIPMLGAEPRPYLEGVAEVDWSRSGTRLVYHTPGPGDPMFVRNFDDHADTPIFTASAGLHAHFPTWSPDDAFIYFVQGSVPDQMDIWRIRPEGGKPERLTFHNSQVSHPAFLNRKTMLYLATEPDGSGPWLYGLDVERRVPHRLNIGPEHYTSLSVSADDRKLVVTVANPKGTLWRVPISSGVADRTAARRIVVPTGRGVSPRMGPGYLLYVSSRDGSEDIWKLADGKATELWSASAARVIGAPAISPDGRRIAFTAEQGDRSRVYVMNADGSALSALSELRQPRGAPTWGPDGHSIAVAETLDGAPRVVRVGLDDGSIAPLVSEYSLDPVWSSDGRFLAYSGADVGTTFPVKSVGADGKPYRDLNITLSRGARRLQFLPGHKALLILRGDLEHKNLWLLDLETGAERQLTNFSSDFSIRDFDVVSDGSEIVFDDVQENSDIVLIDVPPL